MNSTKNPARLAAAIALAAGSIASAQSITPPDFSVLGGTWAFSPPYTQALTGTENINAFRLIADAQEATPTSNWQSDMEMELISPDNTTVTVGGNTTNWNNARFSGTGPTGTGNAQSFDGIYLANMGAIEGTWSVNFRHTFGTEGTLHWNNVQIIPMELPSGACCTPGGACSIEIEAVCTAQGSAYQGDGTDCTVTCPQPPTGACCTPAGACTIEASFNCTTQGGLYRGDGTDCTTTCPLNITAHYDATTNTTVADAGAYFNFTAIEPTGVIIEGFDINSQATAGTPITAHVYVKPLTFVGYETDAGAWTLLGEVQTFAAGHGARTPVPIGGLHIAGGETWGFRVGAANGGIRYSTAANTTPYFNDGNTEIEIGLVQTALFSGSLFGTFPTNLRGWNGSIYYNLGATVDLGACCLPDGSCDEMSEAFCTAHGGTYQGNNSQCATIPTCPQPPTGACCLSDGSCVIVWEPGCLDQGGTYHGDGSDCATIPACPHLITTTYDTNASATNTAGPGAYFLVTALDPQGLTIDSFDINTPATAGNALTAHVYYRPITFVGFTGDQSAWILLGEVAVTSAGQDNPTPVPIGGLAIAENETYALRVGITGAGGIRYNSAATTPPTYANSQIELGMGEVQNNFFGTTTFGNITTGDLRGWSGTIHYSLGAAVTTGACCFPDGSCDELSEAICTNQGGTYHGDNTDCATSPPGGCPQPPTGACCLSDESCIVVWQPGCADQGGLYHGDGTDCATIPDCPLWLSTGWTGSFTFLTGDDTGNFFNVTAINAEGITIHHFQGHSQASAGTAVTAHIYVKPGPFAGFETDASAWTLLGTAETTAAGHGEPTDIPIGSIFIPAGETWGFRVGFANGGARYNTAATTVEFHTDANAEIQLGASQGALFSGAPLSPRGWNGSIIYDIGNTVPVGACCLADGTCDQVTLLQCSAADGLYRGDGVDCGPGAECPLPGACCLQWGDCAEMAEWQCDRLTGTTYNGHGSECSTANCPPSGACCLDDGSCVVVTADQCSAMFNGVFAGAGINCGEARCATAPMLWNNGPLLTDVGIGCGGDDLSALQNQAGVEGNSLGYNWNSGSNSRLADQFIIPEGDEWNISQVILFGYDTGATAVTYTAVYIQIWDGDPTDPASNVVAGDLTTNRLTQADLMDLYRATVTAPTGCTRQIQRIEADLEVTLGEGTYWIDRAAIVSGTGTPWMPPVTFSGLAGKPHAQGMSFFGGSWDPRIDTGNNVQQDLPFVLIGSTTPECYANCDGSTQEPILTVDDFTCFINKFAEAQSLTHEEQVVHYANCDGSTSAPVLTVDDFTCFINAFAQGCP